MPNNNLTHIAVILDRSGSMGSIRSDVVGGFNTFLKEQQEAPGDCTLTLVQFDDTDPYEVLRSMAPIKDVTPLGSEYKPRGNTPLYDAVGKGIVSTGEVLAQMAEDQRPGKVVFVIITDGLENASREYTKERVAALTKHQTEKYNWQFVYLGANQDAMAEGAKFGVQVGKAATYDQEKMLRAMSMTSGKVAEYRTSGGIASALDYSDEDRKELA